VYDKKNRDRGRPARQTFLNRPFGMIVISPRCYIG